MAVLFSSSSPSPSQFEGMQSQACTTNSNVHASTGSNTHFRDGQTTPSPTSRCCHARDSSPTTGSQRPERDTESQWTSYCCHREPARSMPHPFRVPARSALSSLTWTRHQSPRQQRELTARPELHQQRPTWLLSPLESGTATPPTGREAAKATPQVGGKWQSRDLHPNSAPPEPGFSRGEAGMPLSLYCLGAEFFCFCFFFQKNKKSFVFPL